MKVTLSQKISIGVLGVAVVAFVLDRASMSPRAADAAPAAAVAVPLPGGTVVAAPSADPAPVEAMVVSPDGLISERLKSIRSVDVSAVRDAFAPPRVWTAAQRVTVVRQERNPAAEFTAAHRLNAVMASRAGGEAIVDGLLVRIGQKVGDFRLASVDRRSAVFISAKNQATLTLPGGPQ